MKVLKSINRAFTESWIGFGFIVALFLLLLVYFTLPDQFAIRAFNSLSTGPAINETDSSHVMQDEVSLRKEGNATKQEERSEELKSNVTMNDTTMHDTEINNTTDIKRGKEDEKQKEEAPPPKLICDFSDWRYEACEMIGDTRTVGANTTVLYVPPPEITNPTFKNWTLRGQSRKIVDTGRWINVTSLNSSQSAPSCTIRHSIPAIVFALGGLTGNIWHDFSDVLIPLYINSRPFNGEVQFLITNLQTWFVEKYVMIFKKLSRFEIIDFDKDSEVRCFPHVLVGLKSHRDLGIDPTRNPNGYTMFDFRMFIRETYSLPLSVDIPYKMNKNPNKKPRLLLFLRGRNRRFMNPEEIVQSIESSGFEVIQVEPTIKINITEFSHTVDSCDVLMGAHGAGLTNFLFLRTNALMIQVVPYGHMEGSATGFYSNPAKEMKLRFLDYSISAEETTLLEKYGWDDPVIKDPDSIHKQGWRMGMKYYWLEQDIKLNVTRFTPVLVKALELLRE